MSILSIVAASFAVLTLLLAMLAYRSFRAGHYVRGGIGAVVGLLSLAVGVLGGALAVATQGFRALTREETAAVVEVRPIRGEEQAFEATVEIPGEPERTFEVRGDQLYVDAQIVKWRPMVNVLGLHTAYELERLGGRYRDPHQAEQAPRTVHPLGQQRYIELVGMLDRFPVLERVVDAEYGSGTFVDVDRPRRLEVRVSTSGLLIRKADQN